MYLFKTSGETYLSVITNQKHAYSFQLKNWYIGEIALISKNRIDLKQNEKQIRYYGQISNIRNASKHEIEKYWPLAHNNWRYIVEFSAIKRIEKPFDLDDLLPENNLNRYRYIRTFCSLSAEDEKIILQHLFP